MRAMSASSEDDCVLVQDLAPAPPRPNPATRPALQPRDIVLAAWSVLFQSDAQQLVPTILSQFATNLSPTELPERLEWLSIMKRDIATYLRDNAL